MISIIILGVVFLLIAVRQVGSIRLRIWQIMLLGAFGVMVTGQISPVEAVKSINIDVMLFLFGVFIVGHALEESGYLAHLSYRFFRKVKTLNILVLCIIFVMGVFSAFLMNDTLAIIGTPVVLLLAKQWRLPPKLMLLTLAFAITIGSVMSPIGNTQNVLVEINGNVANPFVTFSRFLVLPTMVNLFLAFIVLRLFYKKDLQSCVIGHSEELVKDHRLALLSKLSLILIIVLVTAKIIIVLLNIQVDFRLTYIALIATVPIVVLSPRRVEVTKKIDWRTLVFFVAMFVLMESVWESGFFQSVIN